MQYATLEGKVVVITGASSGIGKLAVEEFLKEGAKVVLASRSDDEMKAHVLALEAEKDQTLVVKTDVSDPDQVNHLANEAVMTFGKIDVWINNAAVNLYGFVEDTTISDIRRVLDVDLMGEIHGMKAALDVFVKQGYGNLLNVSSVDGVIAPPLQAAYAAAKHGVIGFSCALREELMTSRYADMDIDVVDVLPASMDTPLFNQAKSLTGKQPKPFPPVYDPMVTVQALVKHAKSPKPMVIAGNAGRMFIMGKRMMPVLTDRVLSMIGIPGQQSKRTKAIDAEDNLNEPMRFEKTIRGGFKGREKSMIKSMDSRAWLITLGLTIPLFILGRRALNSRPLPLGLLSK